MEKEPQFIIEGEMAKIIRERKEEELKIKKLHVSVEEIIPDIAENKLPEKSFFENNISKSHSFPDNFWQYFLRDIISNKALSNFFVGWDDKERIIYKDSTPDAQDIPDIANGEEYGKHEKNGKALEVFKNQIMIDLGCGESASGYLISQILKSKAYIGVDMYNSSQLEFSMTQIRSSIKTRDNYRDSFENLPGFYKHKIPFAIENSDILSFLKRLPNNSVSIMMGGIGQEVIENYKYRDEILKEIKRVLSPDGGCLTVSSDFYINEEEFKIEYNHKETIIFKNRPK